jgi:para-nitrobenzyl esterase
METGMRTITKRGVAAFVGLIAVAGLAGCEDDPDNVLQPADPLERNISEGTVIGVEEGSQFAFRGIPYAAPPEGDLRFAPPEPLGGLDEPLQAESFGPACPQTAGTFGEPSQNEDCLYLNVYTPKADGDFPVMVWIHGGALTTGSGGPNYRPERLVDEGVVVVTINYRLGALGFLAHPALSDEAGASGDYGLMDQQMALRWVQDNIAAFDGDPDNVTIFGESAGGHSVLSQLASPGASGLFDKAIVQSGSYTPQQLTLAQAEALGADLADELGCSTVSCLRDLPVDEILAAQASSRIPNKRPDFLPLSIAEAISSEDFNQVPVMAGTNRDEGALFIGIEELTRGSAYTPSEYDDRIAALVGMPPDSSRVQAIINEYPLSDYDSTSRALTAVYTDFRFACDALFEARRLSLRVNTYAYEFADRDAPSLIPPGSFDYGAAHAFEIAYVLNTEEVMRLRGAGDAQIALSETMIQYWTSFAKTGDPNPDSGAEPFWPMFSADGDFMELDAPEPSLLSEDDFSTRHQCDPFWLAEN